MSKYLEFKVKISAPRDMLIEEVSRDLLPALHEAITESGFVPKDTSIEAIKYHLEDMRKIVFKEQK